jgi:hypothetical protein
MLDDDIQYLGSRIKVKQLQRFPPRTLNGLSLSFRAGFQTLISRPGVALHVEKSDGNEAYILIFNRDKSSTVLVGRRPGNETESRTLDQENGRAMFRCAVVSRRHAKIAFTDSGNVCNSAPLVPHQQLIAARYISSILVHTTAHTFVNQVKLHRGCWSASYQRHSLTETSLLLGRLWAGVKRWFGLLLLEFSFCIAAHLLPPSNP